jgi:hypothetical protein
MPVRDSLKTSGAASESELQAELEAELESPKETGEPDIVIERPHPSTVHLFVIWSKFSGLEQSVRSSIILDSYAAVKGVPESQKVTVAMGLTPDEAKRMGIS